MLPRAMTLSRLAALRLKGLRCLPEEFMCGYVETCLRFEVEVDERDGDGDGEGDGEGRGEGRGESEEAERDGVSIITNEAGDGHCVSVNSMQHALEMGVAGISARLGGIGWK